MGEYMDSFKAKAKLIGLDVDKMLVEIVDAVEAKLSVKIGQLMEAKIRASLPSSEELSKLIAFKLEGSMVDAVADKVIEKMPSTGAVDEARMIKSITEAVLGNVTDILKQFKAAFESAVGEMRQQNSAELEAQKEAMLGQVKSAFTELAAGNGGAAAPGAGSALDTFMPLFQMLQPKESDFPSVEGLQKLVNLKDTLNNLFGGQGGPDPSMVYRSNQAIFMEGIKIGAKAKGVPALPGPKASSPSGGHLNSPGKRSTRISPIIAKL